jgi:hypothetical protein
MEASGGADIGVGVRERAPICRYTGGPLCRYADIGSADAPICRYRHRGAAGGYRHIGSDRGGSRAPRGRRMAGGGPEEGQILAVEERPWTKSESPIRRPLRAPPPGAAGGVLRKRPPPRLRRRRPWRSSRAPSWRPAGRGWTCPGRPMRRDVILFRLRGVRLCPSCRILRPAGEMTEAGMCRYCADISAHLDSSISAQS